MDYENSASSTILLKNKDNTTAKISENFTDTLGTFCQIKSRDKDINVKEMACYSEIISNTYEHFSNTKNVGIKSEQVAKQILERRVNAKVMLHLIKCKAFVNSFYASVGEKPFEITLLPHYDYTLVYARLRCLAGDTGL